MMSRFRILRLLLVMAPLVIAPAYAQQTAAEQRDWIEGRSAHFRIFSDGRPATAQILAHDLETLHTILGMFIPQRKESSPSNQVSHPAYVYVFKDQTSLLPFAASPDCQGFFSSAQEGNYLAILNDSPKARRAAYSGYISHYLNTYYPGLHPWVFEGLSQFFSEVTIKGDEVTLGVFPTDYFKGLLMTAKPMHLQKLMTLPSPSESVFQWRINAWVAIHYLLVGNPERRAQFGMYANLTRHGVAQGPAFAFAFKDGLEALNAEFQTYFTTKASRQVVAYWRLSAKSLKVDDTFTSLQLSKDQAMARLGMLNLRCMDKEAKHADRLFKQALALDPTCTSAHLGLGLAAIEAGKYAEAKPHILKAAELDPEDATAQFLASQLVVFGGSVTPEQRTQAREFLLRGLARSPGNLDALSRLVMMCSFDGTAMDEVTALILTAIEQYPSKRDLPLKWAEALIRYRKTPMAARVLEAISIEGLDEPSKQKYQTLRTRIEDDAATDRKNEALKRLAAGSIEEGLKGLEEALALPASEKVKAEIQNHIDRERTRQETKAQQAEAPGAKAPEKKGKRK